VPLHSVLVADTRPTVLLLFGGVVLLHLIATANVTNLLQLLTESLVLALADSCQEHTMCGANVG
jgi:hypothetical protein